MKVKIDLLDVSKYPKLEFDSEKIYPGFVAFEAATNKIKDAVAFAITELHVENNTLKGYFQFVNGRATELLEFLGSFDVKTVLEIKEDETINTILEARVDSFYALPDLVIS